MSSPISFPELYKAGFDDFIIPSHETAPFTTIQNRAKVTRSLKAIAGVERINVRSINRLQNEFGPNGEQVWEADNKDSRIRFVGNWTQISDNNSSRPQTATDTTTYTEITFYGTGLNILTIVNSSTHNFVVSIDGGTESSNIVPASYSGVIAGRNYACNQVISIASGLTLGWHTARIRNNTLVNGINFHGFEILNQRTDLAVYQGSGIAQGALNGLSSLTTSSFTDGVTGTRGARVVKYIDNGTLKSAVQAVDASAAYLTAASHTNEEVVRRINFREFGANRADDFSTLSTTTSVRNFTLDDGTTTLQVSSGAAGIYSGTIEGVYANALNAFITITFVGTGLDLFVSGQPGTLDSNAVSIDGSASVGNVSNLSYNGIVKIVSGLPYGTHTIKFTRNAVAGSGLGIADFIIYQPKKPSIPAGALEVADYNVMASYSIAAEGVDTVSAGIIRKQITREMTFSGTWATLVLGVGTTVGGWSTNTNTVNSYMEYTFFGTGFDYRVNSEATQVQTLRIDGSTNFSGFTTQLVHAGATWTPASGTLTGNGVPGGLLSVRGLTLGLHTLRITLTTIGASGMFPEALDIITPIHINQPSFKTGSLSLKSATKYSPEKAISNAGPDLSKAKAWAVIDGPNNTILSSSNISAFLATATGNYLIHFEKPFKNSSYVAIGSCMTGTSKPLNFDARRTNSIRVYTTTDSGAFEANTFSVVFFGELIDDL